ncbi:MAG: molybdopterin cofactor-binding domain-containing protein [Alphaproteobacteria bacterium]
MGIQDMRISRRSALKGAAGLVIGMTLPAGAGRLAQAAGGAPAAFAPNAFVRIGADGIVTVLCKHLEMGQGPFTGMATLVAEELDADWAQIRVEHAPSDASTYANLLFGIQGTGGSTAIANAYEQMRGAGATARALLVEAAAREWDVPVAEITVESGVIRHTASARESGFGPLAEAASRLPAPEGVPLKDPSRFTLIGRDRPGMRVDSADKSAGRARFGIDIVGPELLTVVVAHPPRFGSRVGGFDPAPALAVDGVVAVEEIPTGIAVYATGTWPAIKGRQALALDWDDSAAETRSSAAIIDSYLAAAAAPGLVANLQGDPDAALAGAERLIEADYVFPYLAHAPMEPLNGVLHWDGDSAVATFGSQLQTIDHGALAMALGLTPDKVAIETVLAGGSFGRRGEFAAAFAVELAEVAKAIGPGRPVKLMWTREDDLAGGSYRPAMLHRMRGGVSDGRLVAWTDTIVGQSFAIGTPFESFIVRDGIDATMVEGASHLPYAVPDFRCDLHYADVGVPTLWWRSVGHSHTGYAVECFVDELLEAAGQDPVEGRLALMDDAPRLAGALRTVAALAERAGPPTEGRARGVAAVESFGSYVAQIAEVSADGDGVRVHKVWCAIDCGVAVNPDMIRAQMEGGIGFGLGHALFSQITLDEGRPVETNFDRYRSLRIHEMPEVEVAIVPSTAPPTGVGEPGVPPIAPAVANAMARLGLGRPRRLPMTEGMV